MAQDYVRLRNDLIVESQTVEGVRYFIIREPSQGKFIRLREPEHYLLSHIDGTLSNTELANDFIKTYNKTISSEQVTSFVKQLSGLGFIEGVEAVPSKRRSSLFFKIKAFSPQKLLNWLYPRTRWFFSTPLLILQVMIIFLGGITYFANLSSFPLDIREIFNIGSIATIVISFFLLVTFHEFAHALACVRFGGTVREMGFLLLYFQPCFYCNLSDAYLFKERRQRLIVMFAGLFFQMVLWAGFTILWRLTVEGYFLNEVFRITAMVCFLTLLFNVNPAIRLDGYYLLADYLQIPNLRQKSFSYLWSQIKRRLFGCQVHLPVEPTDRERKIYFRYGIIAIMYSVTLIIFLLSRGARWLIDSWDGTGFLLFLLVCFFMFKRPAIRTARELLSIWRERGHVWMNPKRIAIYLVIVAAVVLLAVVIRFEQTTGGNAQLLAAESFRLRRAGANLLETLHERIGIVDERHSDLIQLSSTDFSITQIESYVSPGDTVSKGDTLVTINSSLSEGLLAEAISELKRVEAERRLLLSDPKLDEIARKKAEVKQAEAIYEAKRRNYNRAKELRNKGLISENEFDQKKADFNVAFSGWETEKSAFKLLRSAPKAEEIERVDADIDRLEARTSYLRDQIESSVIVSPFDGVLLGTTDSRDLFYLACLESLMVRIELSQRDLDIVNPGAEIAIRLAAYPSKEYKGHVIKLKLTPALTAIAMLDVAGNPLLPEMKGYAKVNCGKRPLAALLIRKVSRFFRLEVWSWF